MGADEHVAGQMPTTIASRVASICAVIGEHAANETSMSAEEVAAIHAAIDELAAETAGRRKQSMRDAHLYEQVCKLGEGTFGVVVKARHPGTGQTAALKTLRRSPVPEDDADSAALGEVLREACFMAACAGHPSLVAFHGVAPTPGGDGDHSLFMEYVGPNLRMVLVDRLKTTGRPFPEHEVRGVVRQLLAGAEAMHGRGIIHRDIKPSNILVAENEGNAGDLVVKIGDFGTALSTAERDPEDFWAAGTRSYSAPEMLLEKPGYGTRVDLWSIGCVMAELLTGEVLFDAKNGDLAARLRKIFGVLGAPGERAWGALRTPRLAEEEVQQWRERQRRSRLRDLFPRELLSMEGFVVLRGLLTCNPYRRLDAAAALRLPWFACTDGPTAVHRLPPLQGHWVGTPLGKRSGIQAETQNNLCSCC